MKGASKEAATACVIPIAQLAGPGEIQQPITPSQPVDYTKIRFELSESHIIIYGNHCASFEQEQEDFMNCYIYQ